MTAPLPPEVEARLRELVQAYLNDKPAMCLADLAAEAVRIGLAAGARCHGCGGSVGDEGSITCVTCLIDSDAHADSFERGLAAGVEQERGAAVTYTRRHARGYEEYGAGFEGNASACEVLADAMEAGAHVDDSLVAGVEQGRGVRRLHAACMSHCAALVRAGLDDTLDGREVVDREQVVVLALKLKSEADAVMYPRLAPSGPDAAGRRCPWHSRAYGGRCDLPSGHDGLCSTAGDGFHGGWRPDAAEVVAPRCGCPARAHYDGPNYLGGAAEREGPVCKLGWPIKSDAAEVKR